MFTSKKTRPRRAAWLALTALGLISALLLAMGPAVQAATAGTDMRVLKYGPTTANPGDTVAYDLDVDNVGDTSNSWTLQDNLPAPLTNVQITSVTVHQGTITSTNPSWVTCSVSGTSVNCSGTGMIPDFSTAPYWVQIHVTAVVPTTATTSSWTNTATVFQSVPDPNLVNNTSSVTTTLNQVDYRVLKYGPATVAAGGAVTYWVNIDAPFGPSTTSPWTMTDPLPANLLNPSIVSVTAPLPAPGAVNPPGVTCSLTSGTVTCTGTGMQLDQTASPYYISVKITGTAPASGTLTNTATVSTPAYDPTAANNTSTVNTTIVAGATNADLSVAKTGPSAIPTNGLISWQVSATNNGPDNAATWTITDTVPAGVTNIQVAAPCTVAGSVVTCTGTNLANGATAGPFTIIGTAPATATTLSNTATVSSSTPDPYGANNTSPPVTTTVDPALGAPLLDPKVGTGLAGVAGLALAGIAIVRRRRKVA